MSIILKVAVPVPLCQYFDYLAPTSLNNKKLLPGIRLKIPFGQKDCIGILVAVESFSALPIENLKPVISVLEREPLVPLSLLKLLQWASNYYHYPVGEIILGVLPKIFRQGKCINTINNEVSSYDIPHNPLTLNSYQKNAITTIINSRNFQTFLLLGITGSGKTEVYLHCIDAIIKRGKQALVLVPEIGLTPQTVKRFRERFNVPIVVFHSNLTDRKRAQAWVMAKNGIAKIIIGTRSAVFTPFLNIGIIILDEEHDISFKQQSGFRYSARDLAVMRGRFENIPIVLGSATPSLESFYNTKHKNYKLLSLPKRAGKACLPRITLIDLRKKELMAGMSNELLIAIENHINNNGQVLLFLNRRGYAPVLMCYCCGWIIHCNHCDVHLTVHYCPQRLYCHHCGWNRIIPLICPKCKYQTLSDIGVGTEQLETALKKRFPNHNIVRIDRDSTRTKNSMEKKLDLIHNRQALILVGTQMIAKGHHFPYLTLVAIVDADSGLYSTDFRSLERTGQLLVQVIGRVGRVGSKSEVFIQTYHPKNPLLIFSLRKGYTAFAEALLKERQLAQLPPFSYLSLLRAESLNPIFPIAFLSDIKQKILLHNNNIRVLGPVPACVERKAGRYRYQLLFQSKKRKCLHETLTKLTALLPKRYTKVHWILDVDPQETI
ncbi:replication restart helicase PriA [Coxiella endosymbiont of Amblyomma americanum]|uniref:replication restart helicase PriA n=1 Tax=Coxiella endosymbiont of Amblyomma americanum TaxID=325775 RepID=UPI00057D9692|nr:primosomal protein N' [Coxiella endosymbiont of Amblyomma americanum]AJC50191.1 replication restart DNA helicase PriA [Coxiella endosymbiont of Amblyomma americanum]AUJ58552.1 primosomal protein N' [Coxiella-like endosymbiont of Amblyomma americanum]